MNKTTEAQAQAGVGEGVSAVYNREG